MYARIFVKVELEDQDIEYLSLLRDEIGMKNFSDTIRYLIRREAKKMKKMGEGE